MIVPKSIGTVPAAPTGLITMDDGKKKMQNASARTRGGHASPRFCPGNGPGRQDRAVGGLAMTQDIRSRQGQAMPGHEPTPVASYKA